MKKRKGEPWLAADVYGQSLQGLTINLISENLERALIFQQVVLGADIVYHDADFAAVRGYGAQWMIHADHTYDNHPLNTTLAQVPPGGMGGGQRRSRRRPGLAWPLVKEKTLCGQGGRPQKFLDRPGNIKVRKIKFHTQNPKHDV